jgi:hypothetical protein
MKGRDNLGDLGLNGKNNTELDVHEPRYEGVGCIQLVQGTV